VKADHRHGEGGVVTVEVAALLPVLLLAVALCLSVTGVVRDHLVVQSAAGAGARAAATSTDPGAVRRAAAGRPVDVALAPARWRPGDLVRVTVRTSSRVAGVTVEVTGRAAARVEPGARP
jgi:Flp pilus assembly protein TadG